MYNNEVNTIFGYIVILLVIITIWYIRFLLKNSNVLKCSILNIVGVGLGNQLSNYFYNYYLCCLNKTKFVWNYTKYKSKICQKLPNSIPLIELSYYPNKIKNPNILKQYYNMISSWETNNAMWYDMQPVIKNTLLDIYKSFNAPHNYEYDVIIHYRLGDIPFCKHPSYELLIYNWYLDALNLINNIKNIKVNRILIITNYTRNNKHINLSIKYYNNFVNFLENQGYLVSTRTDGTVEQDFFTLMNAPNLIASTSSFGFFAGIGADSNQVFIYPTSPNSICKYDYRKNMISLQGRFLKHSEMPDYYNTEKSFDILQNRI